MNYYIRLKAERSKLTRQQYNTLKGQIRSGDPDGAMRGLDKILNGVNHEPRNHTAK